MVDHLADEKKWLDYWKGKYRQKAVRELKNERKFPACKWYELTSPANNKYVVFFYSESQRLIEKPKVD